MSYCNLYGIFVISLMMCSVCLAEEPSESKEKPIDRPDAKTDETNRQQGDSKLDSVIIPLDQVWALDMPGMRDINELYQGPYPDKPDLWLVRKKMSHSLTEEIRDTTSEENALHELGAFCHGL